MLRSWPPRAATPRSRHRHRLRAIPHFIVIGAKKSGTTWLDRNLRVHPAIWLPPEKELHYFDLPRRLPFIFFVFALKRGQRYWVVNRLKRAYRKAMTEPGTLGWFMRYYLLPRTDRWYRSLFRPADGRLTGDTTPDYATLHNRRIAHCRALYPDARIIYLLRDPIAKMWSQASMHFSERAGFSGIHTIAEETLVHYFHRPRQLAHARYFANLQRWERHYPADRIFVGFFDDIVARPDDLLNAIFRFLGIAADADYISALAREKIFARDYPALPPAIARLLAGLLIDDLEQLDLRLRSPYTGQWLAAARSCLTAGGAGALS